MLARYRNEWLMTTSLYEAMVTNGNVVTLDATRPLKVLCIGNSITHHGPSKGDIEGSDSLWRGDWGMCASKEEFDFVHRIETKLKNYNDSSVVIRKNLWVWEQNFEINKDSLLKDSSMGTDLIILKIGENVKKGREATFGKAFADLTKYCLKITPNVIIAGGYWEAPVKEQAMISSAREYGLPYVPLFWIYKNHREEVIAQVGDTIYDRQGKPYPVPTEFICTHPNDEGMRMIAEAIWGKIKFE